jgi:hypothetical protein
MQIVDPSIIFEQIEVLEWPGTHPLLFENVEGRLNLTKFTNSAASLLCLEGGRLPWFPL